MKVLFLVGVIGLMSGCGAFETKEKGGKAEENDMSLTGVWNTDCSANDMLELSHAKQRLAFSAVGDFDKKESLYGDEGCASEKMNVRLLGTYAEVGNAAVGNGVKNINFTVNHVRLSIVDADYVAVANRLEVCGKDDWVAGEVVEVAGKSCFGRTINAGDVLFDVYKVDSEAFFGQRYLFLSEDDADARPENVLMDLPFHKE